MYQFMNLSSVSHTVSLFPYIFLSVFSFFDPQTGIVYVNRPLDREKIAEYKLTVSVKDNPENARNSRKVILNKIEQCSILNIHTWALLNFEHTYIYVFNYVICAATCK